MHSTQESDLRAVIAHQLRSFEPISLDELKRAELMRRIDRKYIVHLAHLPLILQKIMPHYGVLTIENRNQFEYETQYLDTADFLFYHQHHNGRSNRQKIRYRHYRNTDARYLEVKSRSAMGRIVKERLKLDGEQGSPSESRAFIAQRVNGALPDALGVKTQTHYQRATLAHKVLPERVTIDMNLRFSVPGRAGYETVSSLAIIEVKYEKLLPTEIISTMRTIKSYRSSFSKYCIGCAMLYPKLKHNRFKPQLLIINRIADGHDFSW